LHFDGRNSETRAVRWVFVHAASWGVGIAVAAVLWAEGYTWEGILVGVFCGVPVFGFGAWLAARGDL
jgi:hypothetical protein